MPHWLPTFVIVTISFAILVMLVWVVWAIEASHPDRQPRHKRPHPFTGTGWDVYRGKEQIAHFEGADQYQRALRYASRWPGALVVAARD